MTPTQKTALLRLYGLGSLSEADEARWPWWDLWTAVFPDLLSPTPEADAAAVQVALKLSFECDDFVSIWPPYRTGKEGWVICLGDGDLKRPIGEGDTLREAVVAVLEVQR